MANKDLLSIYDLSNKEIRDLLKKTFKLKNKKKYLDVFKGKTLGIMLEKPSTRTMVSFAVAMAQLGGTPIFLTSEKMQRSRGESIHDTSKVLSKYLNGLMIRAFKHADVVEFANHCSIPIINGLTDYEHPCQILADIMTIMELLKAKTVETLKKVKIVYIGDSNNIVNSLIAISAMLGLDLTIISPTEYQVKNEILKQASQYALKTKAEIKVTSDVNAAKGADVIYTDVWTSMGFEIEKTKRKKIFTPYQVNSELLKKASSKCIVLHCLPALRGEEITTDIMDKYKNSIFTQAEIDFMSKKQYSYTSSNKKVVLASCSPRRISLLKQWGLFFAIRPSNVNETTHLKRPSYIVKDLAFRKANTVAKQHGDKIVLAADTIVVLNGRIIGKPKDKKESENIIKKLNGTTHKVYTGVAIIYKNKKNVFYDVSSVKMKNLSQKNLKQFFGKHMDKAGSYAIQDSKDNFVEKIYGDYYTVVGLPYIKLTQELKKFNIYLKQEV
jgi:ornithine carbamoyltransferase